MKQQSRRHRRPTAGVLALLCLAIIHHRLPVALHAPWTATLIIVGTLSIRRGIASHGFPDGSGWRIFAGGLTVYTASDLTYLVIVALLGPEHPAGSVAWSLGLLAIPWIVGGVRREMASGRRAVDMESYLDAGILALSVGYVGWQIVGTQMIARDGWLSFPVLGGSVVWATAVVTLGLILSRGISTGGGTPSLWLFATAVPVTAASSVVYWTVEHDLPWASAPASRVLMALAYALAALAFWHPSARHMLGNGPRRRPWIRLVAVAVALTVPPLWHLGVALGVAHDTHDLTAALLGLLMIGVALARLSLTLRLRNEAQRGVTASESRFRSLVEHAYGGVLTLDRDMRITWAANNAGSVTGLHSINLIGRTPLMEINRADHASFRRSFATAVLDAESRVPGRCRLITVSGEERWVDYTLASQLDNPAVDGVILNYRDITDQVAAEDALVHEATHDGLTGLPNRVLLTRTLTEALEQTPTAPVAVLFLDLDRFKVINDSLGHRIGDLLLVSIAARLRRVVGESGIVTRHGGDEFVVVCPGVQTQTTVMLLASRICQALGTPIIIGGHTLTTTASIGIALRLAGEDAEDLLRDADTAMYQAKARGRDGFVVFDRSTREAAEVRQQLEAGLRKAMIDGDLTLHYQPVLALRGDRIKGVEALLRWADHVVPEGPVGVASPAEMVRVAEESGLISSLGAWVLDRALSDLVRLDLAVPDNGLTMAVNVSGDQMRRPGFAEQVMRALDRSGLGPERLILELTESVVVEDAPIARHALATLRAAGVRMAMDDFGTGYSALANLKRIPISQVKVDRSFVDGLADDSDDGAIVRAVVGMAHALGLVVVAEGVETSEQQSILRGIGCDLVQGFLLGRPMPLPELCERVASSLASSATAG